MLFKLLSRNSNLALTQGYLNPALNYSAQVDIYVMSKCQKRASVDQCHMTETRAQVYNSLRRIVFFKVIH